MNGHNRLMAAWSEANICFSDVRFRGPHWGRSGHALLQRTRPLLTQSGHRGPRP